MGSTMTIVMWQGHSVHWIKELQTPAGAPRIAAVMFDRMTHVVKLRDLKVVGL